MALKQKYDGLKSKIEINKFILSLSIVNVEWVHAHVQYCAVCLWCFDIRLRNVKNNRVGVCCL